MYDAKVNVNLMKENLIQVKSGITKHVDANVKFITYVKIYYIWKSATCSCENGKYLASIMGDKMITCDEIINAEAKSYDEETKTVTTNFNGKNIICKTKTFYILFAFLLITTALLIAASICCYLIKYKSTFVTILREVLY